MLFFIKTLPQLSLSRKYFHQFFVLLILLLIPYFYSCGSQVFRYKPKNLLQACECLSFAIKTCLPQLQNRVFKSYFQLEKIFPYLKCIVCIIDSSINPPILQLRQLGFQVQTLESTTSLQMFIFCYKNLFAKTFESSV